MCMYECKFYGAPYVSNLHSVTLVASISVTLSLARAHTLSPSLSCALSFAPSPPYDSVVNLVRVGRLNDLMEYARVLGLVLSLAQGSLSLSLHHGALGAVRHGLEAM